MRKPLILSAMLSFSIALFCPENAFSQSNPDALTADQYFSSLANDEFYAHRDWDTPSRGKGNYFLFVFRDVNRNGIYDLGDRPLPAIHVKLTMPSGQTARTQSNMNGFAAFPTSRFRDNVVITEPGRHQLEAIIPSGWSNSSNNATQFLEFRDKKESIAGMIAGRMPDPVGLVQDLYITGQVKTGQERAASDVSITATRSGQEFKPIEVDKNGKFFFFVSQGDWILTFDRRDGRPPTSRAVTINNAPVHLSETDLSATAGGKRAHEKTLDFENLTGSALAELPSGVGGLNWHNMVATDFLFYNGPGYMNNSISGHFVAYSSGGHPVTIWHDEPFDFVGGYFGVAWPEAHGETLIARAWSDGELIAEDRVPLSALGPVWFDAEYRGVDRVELSTEHYWQFVADDMVVRTAQE